MTPTIGRRLFMIRKWIGFHLLQLTILCRFHRHDRSRRMRILSAIVNSQKVSQLYTMRDVEVDRRRATALERHLEKWEGYYVADRNILRRLNDVDLFTEADREWIDHRCGLTFHDGSRLPVFAGEEVAARPERSA